LSFLTLTVLLSLDVVGGHQDRRRLGRAALASKGTGGAWCNFPAQLRELGTLLDTGPAAYGWDEDQCWTLARIAEVVRRRFGGYTLAGMDLLLPRIG
jgi:hypothetical protein